MKSPWYRPLVLVALAASMASTACGEEDVTPGRDATSGGSSSSTSSSGAGGHDARTLGLNDVTVLVPLPQAPATVLLRAADKGDDGTALVPLDLYHRLNDAPLPGVPSSPPIVGEIYDDLQVFAIRFDL